MSRSQERRGTCPTASSWCPLPTPARSARISGCAPGSGRCRSSVDCDSWIRDSARDLRYHRRAYDPTPGHPRLSRGSRAARPRAACDFGFVRTGLFALREARPTSTSVRREAPERPKVSPVGYAAAPTPPRPPVASRADRPGQANRGRGTGASRTATLSLRSMRLVANCVRRARSPSRLPAAAAVGAPSAQSSSTMFDNYRSSSG